MKKIIALAAFAALAACSQAEEADDTDTMADETSVTEQAPAVADEGPEPGDYVATYPDGSELAFTTTADGTFTATQADGTTANGTFELRDGKTCFVSDPPSEDDSCWGARVMSDDGSWTSTNDAGVTVTVRPAA
ncbi:hypothetical protein [Qipengyuania sphaerica]|uniref:hypothetical protein n=1 Tax=Qipengyuania sphaerica TaxID=2867243 RepID=UPI001C876472|nr:hypothetical protein [Qipengyuania sphaerica]MBX7540579.1 hypothetical protein [Qipengyuania sphaerica]